MNTFSNQLLQLRDNDSVINDQPTSIGWNKVTNFVFNAEDAYTNL